MGYQYTNDHNTIKTHGLEKSLESENWAKHLAKYIEL